MKNLMYRHDLIMVCLNLLHVKVTSVLLFSALIEFITKYERIVYYNVIRGIKVKYVKLNLTAL